jgi:hypothetical protein
VLELPHPPLTGRIDLECLVGRPLEVEEDVRAPDEDHDADEKWNDGPRQLEGNRAVNPRTNLHRIAGAVLRSEKDHHDCDQNGDERGHREDEEVQRVYICGER